jgi:hypothetical protein
LEVEPLGGVGEVWLHGIEEVVEMVVVDLDIGACDGNLGSGLGGCALEECVNGSGDDAMMAGEV